MARALSLLLATAASAVGLIIPFALARQMTPMAHMLASLMMIGVAGAFVHGVGFRPENRMLRLLFSPAIAWPLIVGGAALMVLV